jgi:tetratricopeptide (TPR) repeat protein
MAGFKQSLLKGARWLLARLLLAVLVPLFAMLSIEAVLQISNAGYPTSLLLSSRIQARPVWVNNPFYGYRFFSPTLARNPPPIVIDQKPLEQRQRIVVLGESAALGDPVPQFGAPRMLEKMLRVSSDQNYEVINAAMTAINATIIADMATELRKLSPDIVILYIGNNEVVGPYGPGSIFGSDRFPWLTDLRVRLTRLRSGQVIKMMVESRAARERGAENFGMHLFDAERVPAADSRLESVYRRYENRMEAILRAAQSTGARVILCTMAVNLTANGPFGSAFSGDRSPEQQQAWLREFNAGVQAQERGADAVALRAFEAARNIDDQHAELLYRMGQSAMGLGDRRAALEYFSQARDLDTLRFRADSRINAIIRKLAERYPVSFVDVEAAFAGRDCMEMFLDHVHFTFEGTHALAGLWLHAVAETDASLPPLDLMRQHLFFSPWLESQQIAVMRQRRSQQPFTARLDNERYLNRFAKQQQEIEALRDGDHLDRYRSWYAENRERDPNDVFNHQLFGSLLMFAGMQEEALSVLLRTVEQVPHYSEFRIMPAYLLAMSGKYAEAAEVMLGGGPPYGWFLSKQATGIMSGLVDEGYALHARGFGQALLDAAPRFAGRDQLAWRFNL